VRNTLSRMLIATLVGVSFAGVVVGNSAFAVSKASGVHSVLAPSLSKSSAPELDIKGQGRNAYFAPASLEVQEDTSGADCLGDKFVSVKIINTGTKTAYLTLGGGRYEELPAGKKNNLCIYGGSPGQKEIVGLSNETDTKTFPATATLTFTD
jgi:hypothetical protein